MGADAMIRALDVAGSSAGMLGLAVCLASGAARIAGGFYLGGVPTVTVFLAGAGLLLAGCYLKLEAASLRARR
jgi:hypothetical protein